jgi:hypothetical protein
VIGLLITVAEVIHSIQISKSIRDEAKVLVDRLKVIESASGISDCLAVIDDVSVFVSKEDYWSALKSFQFLRKICAKLIPDVWETNSTNTLSLLGDVEFMLHKATHTTVSAPLNKRQKTDLLEKILRLKQQIEDNNPARNSQDVTK